MAALLIVLTLGAALRLAFFPRAPVLVHGDSYQYYRPAAALLTGDGFPLPLKRPPLYPAFVAVVGWGLGEDMRRLAAVQHLLGLGTAALTYGIGRLTFGRRVGLLAGLAAALSGGLLVYEHYILTEALFAVLVALAVFLLLLGLRRDSLWLCASSGLVIGLAALTRVHAQILLLAPLLAALLCRRWCPIVRGTLVAGLAAAVMLVPWMTRNYVVHGDLTVAARSGQSLIYLTLVHHPGQFVFYDRANPPEDADPKLEQARKFIQERADEKAENPSANILGITIHAWLMENLELSEAEANAIMRDVALDAIMARPLTYARVVLEEARKIFADSPEALAYHWRAHHQELRDNPPPKRLRPLIGPASPEQEQGFAFTEQLVDLYQSARFGPLVPVLFLVGLLAGAVVPAWRPALVPALTVLVLHAVTLAVVGFGSRYRQPVEPLTHVVALGGLLFIGQLIGSLAGRIRRPAASRIARSEEAGFAPP